MEKGISKYEAECLVEVDAVLCRLSPEELKKIPLDVRDAINEFKSIEYAWFYDDEKPLSEQDLRKESVAILSALNMQYLLNDDQRKLMDEIHIVNEYKEEKEEQQKEQKAGIIKRLFKLGE
jgi:hypothetical protein